MTTKQTTCGWDAVTQTVYERPMTEEDILQQQADAAERAREDIRTKMKDLEAQQTERLVREAVLGGDYAIEKLTQIEAEISALREKL